MKIKMIVAITSSKIDRNGNTYGAVIVTNTETGASIKGVVDCHRNWTSFARYCGLEWGEVYNVERELPIREYNRFIKGLSFVEEAKAAEAIGFTWKR